MLEWLASNWYIIVFSIIVGIGTYMNKKRVLEWLKWAVSQAEKELGGGTGQIKLRQVYDMFIQRFPIFSKFITFNIFSLWVDEALIFLKDQLEKNEKIKEFIEK